jgi:hypothetical protein
VIDVDHLVGGTIQSPATAIRRGLKPFDVRTDPRTILGDPMSQILMVKKILYVFKLEWKEIKIFLKSFILISTL